MRNQNQEARKYEFLGIIKPWNQSRKEANKVHIHIGGDCAGHLAIYNIQVLRQMTEDEFEKNSVPFELWEHTLDWQTKVKNDALKKQMMLQQTGNSVPVVQNLGNQKF